MHLLEQVYKSIQKYKSIRMRQRRVGLVYIIGRLADTNSNSSGISPSTPKSTTSTD